MGRCSGMAIFIERFGKEGGGGDVIDLTVPEAFGIFIFIKLKIKERRYRERI